MKEKILSLELDDFELEGDSSPKQKKVRKDPVLEKIVSCFEGYINKVERFGWVGNFIEVCVKIRKLSISESLNDFVIQKFIDTIKPRNIEYFGGKTELFISGLLYENQVKEKEFLLDLTGLDLELNDFCCELKNKNLDIIGDLGENCGYHTENCSFKINGNVGDNCGYRSEYCNNIITGKTGIRCGDSAKDCTFTLFGDVGKNCGINSKDSSFTLFGDVGEYCGFNSKGSSFTFFGDVGQYCGRGLKCTFKAIKRETYNKICKSAEYSNTVQLIDFIDDKEIVLEEKLIK